MPPSPTPNATASIAVTGSGPEYTYTVTVNNIGSTTVGTFWFSWIPGQDYMTAMPTSISSPAGWNAQVTTANYSGQTGYAIEWQANGAASDIQSGGSSSSFSFNSTETPAQMAADSPFDGKPQTATAVVYTGGALIGNGDTLVASVAACYREGTSIRTPHGDQPIETLSPGDRVVTESGEIREVIWTGRRHVVCDRHPDPARVWPVRVSRGALGDSTPCADLWLSPDHALLLDGVLVPVKHLVNGTTIARVPAAEVTWHHLELASHDAILAEGAASETYLDTGDRWAFGDRDEAVLSRPRLAMSGRTGMVREAESRWPLVVMGPKLAAIRQRLATRAGTLMSEAAVAEAA
jgi:hypothetical protein